jgi:histidinol-phosphate/aromatic aminotransferase/cobyric acid decarboxylase-like protein
MSISFSDAYLRAHSRPPKSERQPSLLAPVFPRLNADRSIINFGVADNRLMSDLLLPKFQNRPSITDLTLTYAGCAPTATNFLPALCSFYRDYLGIPDASPGQFVLGSGISHLIEKLGFLFLNPGDAVLLPVPTYHKFSCFLERFKPNCVYIDPENLPEKPPENARLLLITNPGNPFGEYVNPGLVEWGLRNPNCQVIIDEVYAMCDKRPDVPFVSLFANQEWDQARVHHCYGISKDWGMAGQNLGFFLSRSKKVVKAMRFAMGTFTVAADTVKLMEDIFGDAEFVASFVAALKKRLAEAEETAVGVLREGGLKVLTSTSSLFINLDLSEYVHSGEEEIALMFKLLDAKVFILPQGAEMHGKCGVYRIVYASPREQLIEGCQIIVRTVRATFPIS